jgi:uncharacterized membrane protein YidH (DUF202 family)
MISPEFPTVALFGLKILILVGIGVYAIFALVMVQQTRLMANVLEDPLEAVLKIISVSHLVAAVLLFLLALILL